MFAGSQVSEFGRCTPRFVTDRRLQIVRRWIWVGAADHCRTGSEARSTMEATDLPIGRVLLLGGRQAKYAIGLPLHRVWNRNAVSW